MKQVILPLLFLLPFAAKCQQEASSKDSDVRKCKWGMTQAEVKAAESLAPYMVEKNKLYYKVEVDSYKFILSYEFESEKLIRATLIYNETHINSQSYWNNFKRIAERMDGKYGEHTDLTKWSSDLFKQDERDYGFAVSNGDVSFHYAWYTDKTKISLIMSGEDYQVVLGVVYKDSNHETKETEFKPKP